MSNAPTHISYTGAGLDWHESEEKAIERQAKEIEELKSEKRRLERCYTIASQVGN